jgi:hypothetical protein
MARETPDRSQWNRGQHPADLIADADAARRRIVARRMQPERKVLLTSGYALEALAERGRLPAGAVVLNKPYRKADLAKRVREALAPATA